MPFAMPIIQVWLAAGLGLDTTGDFSKQAHRGGGLVARDATRLPVAGGLFLSLGIADAPDGFDRSRIGVGFFARMRVNRWLLAGAAFKVGSQERETGSDRLFVAVDLRLAVPFTADARGSLELSAGAQGEKQLAIFGHAPPGESTVNASARVVVRL